MENPHLSKKLEKVSPFYVMELLEAAKEMEARGEDIVHMEVGEPDFPTPSIVKEEAKKAIGEDKTFYTHSLGLSELRERIKNYYLDAYGISIEKDRIIITNGTSGAFLIIFLGLLEKGKKLVISDPGYPCYKNFGYLVDGEVCLIPVTEKTGYMLTKKHIIRFKYRPDVVVISNPSNPTGSVYDMETIEGLYEEVSKRAGILIVDEIYSGLNYSKKIFTALSISEDIFVVDGFSKTYAMTGWRLGWMVAPKWFIRAAQKIGQNVYISPPSISQHAAIKAFDAEKEIKTMRETYKKRRDFMLQELNNMGFYIPVIPEGAFYIYAGIEKWGMDSMDFVKRALVEAKVAITPGYDFGNFRAGKHVRFSYANSLNRL
ncbi:MAG: aminotransferase class I/II-fold pyridoxal phosphate-dependent enzyme, partial [Syntrophorhabdaceae bacterium]|nr:aminotransferase class I/II-fold pyridoxal phosphate-dependent enzyme [Syntrophorhabdaceae bacterium]